MAITHQQFIQLLADKLGRTTEEVSEELKQLIEQIKTAAEKGDDFTIDKFGTFKLKNGRLSFEVDSTFALEINYKYAGMTPVELKGGKATTVSDEEVNKPRPIEPGSGEEEQTIKPGRTEKIPDASTEKKEAHENETADDKSAKSKQTESETGQVSDEEPSGVHEDDLRDEDKKTKQEKAHIYRSPNQLLSDDESPKRRTGLFVTIAILLVALFAGYYFIVHKGHAPIAENAMSSDSVYVRDDNTNAMNRNAQKNAPSDSSGSPQSGAPADSVTAMASNMEGSGSTMVPRSNQKKSVTTNTATVSVAVATKDSMEAHKILSDLSGTTLYGLHGKASNEIGDYYTIVVVSLRDQSKARLVGKRWENRHFRVVVAPGQVKGQTWYRVGLGQFSTISEAENAVKELPDQLQDNQHHFIRRIHQ